MEKFLIEAYLDFVNNFLTVQGFADYYSINIELAQNIINTGKEFYYLNKGESMNKKKIIIVYADPGHAWGKVKKEELIELGIADKISSCSYQKGNYAYLEEDSDLSKYLDALRAKGMTWEFAEIFTNERSKVRFYENFNSP